MLKTKNDLHISWRKPKTKPNKKTNRNHYFWAGIWVLGSVGSCWLVTGTYVVLFYSRIFICNFIVVLVLGLFASSSGVLFCLVLLSLVVVDLLLLLIGCCWFVVCLFVCLFVAFVLAIAIVLDLFLFQLLFLLLLLTYHLLFFGCVLLFSLDVVLLGWRYSKLCCLYARIDCAQCRSSLIE